METLQLLALALGLASLAGVNLYLTVFLSGLSIQQGWLTLAEPYTALQVLADPVVMTVAGIFFLLEFFADKIPWVDSIWDSVHTFIRPVGASLLAVLLLGEHSEAMEIVAILLAGGTAFATHSLKATSRLLINASPEPFSNIAASLAEDGLVVGGLFLLAWNPLVGLALAVAALFVAVFLGTKVFRLLRSRGGFAWRKLTASTDAPKEETFSAETPLDLDCILHQQITGEVRIARCLPCVSGKLPSTPSNVQGYLVATCDYPPLLFWAGKASFRFRIVPIHFLTGSHEFRKGFLFDKAIFKIPSAKKPLILLFDRTFRAPAEHFLASLSKTKTSPPSPESPENPECGQPGSLSDFTLKTN